MNSAGGNEVDAVSFADEGVALYSRALTRMVLMNLNGRSMIYKRALRNESVSLTLLRTSNISSTGKSLINLIKLEFLRYGLLGYACKMSATSVSSKIAVNPANTASGITSFHSGREQFVMKKSYSIEVRPSRSRQIYFVKFCPVLEWIRLISA